jgi:hypothetical protein
MRKYLLLLLSSFLLAGCPGSKPIRITGSGVEAPPPVGYIVWCSENPGDLMCGAKR